MQKINDDTDAAVKKLLSEEQFQKYQETQTKTRQRRGDIGGNHNH